MVLDSNLYRQDPTTNNSGERNVAVHFPRTLPTSDTATSDVVYNENPPDWYSATIPALAIPTSEVEKRSFHNTYEFPYFVYMILEID